MKYMLRNILLLSLSIALVNCDEDEVTSRDYPRLNTLPATDITSEGARFNAEIIFRGDFEIINYGFVWGESENPTLTNSDRVIYSENIRNETFTSVISRALEKDNEYYVRSFVQTNDYVVYGQNEVFLSFGSKPPIITKIEPANIYYNDTIQIYGKNFSARQGINKVKINGKEGPIVIYNSDSLISFVIPDESNLKSFLVSLTTAGNEVQSTDSLFFIPPKISSVVPEVIVYGDTIDISGRYFGYKEGLNFVTINGSPVNVLHSDSNNVKVIVPIVSEPINIKLTNSVGQFDENTATQLGTPSILSISISSGFIGDQLTIYGDNFGYIQNGIMAQFDENQADIITSSNNGISLYVPNGIYNTRFPDISVSLVSKADTTSGQFEILDSWIRKNDIPNPKNTFDKGYYGAIGFSINDYGYVGLGFGGGGFNSQDFWQYDPSLNTWKQVASFPGSSRYFASSFVIGNDAYVGGGIDASGETQDFWKYNSLTNSWSEIASFPYKISRAVGLGSSDIGYITTRSSDNNFWRFDTNSGEWLAMPDIQVGNTFRGVVDSGFELNDKLYIYVSGNSTGIHELHEFDPSTNIWSRKSDLPSNNIDGGVTSGASLNGNGYIFKRDYYMYRYDPISDSWMQLNRPSLSNWDAICFSINNQIYFGGGRDNAFSGCGCDTNDFWEYDPSYDQE